MHPLREVFNGLRYVARYGIAWRAMPNDLPPRHAVYDQAQRWPRAGCFEMLAHIRPRVPPPSPRGTTPRDRKGTSFRRVR